MAEHLTLPYFDGATVEMFEASGTPQERAAVDTFLTLGPADRLRDSRHVYAYYRDFHQAVGGKDWLDAEMGVPATPQDIWPHVTPTVIGTDINPDDGLAYVTLECNCAWEEEHGLMMVWRAGRVLNKVGGYDGHLTNANAYADDTLKEVVYSASDPDLTTRLDP